MDTLSINVNGKLLDMRSPLVMGILNVTPDSFHAGSRVTPESIVKRAGEMLSWGADILDIGGMSTRPGAEDVSEALELERVGEALKALRSAYPDAVISVDTFRSDVARAAVLDFGADIINDIGGGEMDPRMFDAVAEMKVPYVLMHSHGIPTKSGNKTAYNDVATDVLRYLAFKTDELHQLGVCDVIIDPGFGFAKDTAQNYELLSRLSIFKSLGCPILAGMSRKRMVQEVIGSDAAGALCGTTAVNMLALLNGANILRVHDVKEARDTVKIFMEYSRCAPKSFNTVDTYTQEGLTDSIKIPS